MDAPTPKAPRNAAAAALPAIAGLLLLAVCAWPLLGGMIAANDDLKFVRGDAADGPLWDRIVLAWRTNSNFRPLDVAVGAWCDPLTLACGWAIAVQLAGLAALCVAAWKLARRALPTHPAAASLLLAWIALSPATTVSMWQMDTCSQTWAAALAAWAGLAAWDVFDAAAEGRTAWGRLALLGALFLAGCTVKEIFYGWSFGIGLACGAGLVATWRRSRAQAMHAAWVLLPVVVLPIVHLAVRWKTSALGGVASGTGGGARYKMEVGENLVMNAVLSIGGLLAGGPLHLIADDQASLALRSLPFLGLLAALCLAGAALGFLAYHRGSADGIRWRAVFLCAFAGLASLAITLPMGSVSDLYGFGANIGSGLLLAACAASLWSPVASDERTLCRGIAVTMLAGIALVGAYGLASRAYHFRTTWRMTAMANDAMLAAQDALPAEAGRPPIGIRFAEDCYARTFYGQVMVSPIQSIDLEDTIAWMNRRDPARRVAWGPEAPLPREGDPRPVIDCAGFPVREHR
jgi:hypothetical protein